MMLLIVCFHLCLHILLVGSQISGVSVNRPKLSACASWNATGITFANSNTIGSNPGTVFVNTNDTIYVTDRTSYRVQIWQTGSINITRTLSGGLDDPLGLFVSDNGDIYVDNGYVNSQIDKWTAYSTTSVAVTYFSGGRCYGIFIDANSTLYCSLNIHKVIKISLNSTENMTQLAAGNGTAGNTAYMLNWPRGIFVDINFDLYVADGNNNRIQKLRYGSLNGTTVAGTGSTSTFSLNGPSSVVLDADGYLFIVDQNNNRIVGSGPNGYRCLVGCSEQAGATSSQLNGPYSMSFDSNGNIYVTDKGNGRVQMFIVANTSCATISTQQQSLISKQPSLLISTARQVTISTTKISSNSTANQMKTTTSQAQFLTSSGLCTNNCAYYSSISISACYHLFIMVFFIFYTRH